MLPGERDAALFETALEGVLGIRPFDKISRFLPFHRVDPAPPRVRYPNRGSCKKSRSQERSAFSPLPCSLVLLSGITLTSFFDVAHGIPPQGHEAVSTSLKQRPIKTTAKSSHCLRSGFLCIVSVPPPVVILLDTISHPRPLPYFWPMNLVLIAPDHVPFICLAHWACSCHAAPHWLINSRGLFKERGLD